ncbi:MAG: molybdate ABC transporter permease subunit [Gammaproteobacteria bacterium]|nr:molybdate ABC transporter permease subunit [Gammaproteobacteria bacterium]
MFEPVLLSLQLATSATIILLIVSIPLAWWLANGSSIFRSVVWATTALPLVLPPTVLGFYLLLAFSPASGLGKLIVDWFGVQLAFSFAGLLIASVIYSLPFVVQPLQIGFERLDGRTIEAALSLRANWWVIITRVIFPQLKGAFLVAFTLGFAHTLGEFGVVLMIGGNIPGETQVISIAIYESVEMLDYAKAHLYSVGLLVFSFIVLFLTYARNSFSLKRKGE